MELPPQFVVECLIHYWYPCSPRYYGCNNLSKGTPSFNNSRLATEYEIDNLFLNSAHKYLIFIIQEWNNNLILKYNVSAMGYVSMLHKAQHVIFKEFS